MLNTKTTISIERETKDKLNQIGRKGGRRPAHARDLSPLHRAARAAAAARGRARPGVRQGLKTPTPQGVLRWGDC